MTLLGIIVVPLGLFWLFKLNSTKLLYLFTAVTPFSAATIVEFKGSTFGMPPSFFIGILLIIALLIKYISHRSKICVDGLQKYYYLSFSILWLYSFMSLLLPAVFLLFGNSYSLFNPAFADQNYSGDVPTYTVTQFVYFTFFLATTFAVMIETTNICVAKKSLKIILEVAMFTVIWGIVFYILNFAGVTEYPHWVFNNHPGYSQGYDQKFSILSRMASVAQEPSIYGYFLSIMISMVMTFNVLDFYVLKPATQKIFCFVMIATALMTTSSTAFLGIFISIMMTTLLAILCKVFGKALSYLFKQLVVLSVVGISLFIIIIQKINFDKDAVVDTFYQLTILKATTGSGEERSESFFHGIKVLSDTFYLGSGFGSNRNFDLGSTILANTGIIGLILFMCSFGGVILISLLKAKKILRLEKNLDDAAKITIGLVSALMTALALMFTSVPDYVNMYFWLIIGLLMGTTKLISNKPKSNVMNDICSSISNLPNNARTGGK